VDETPTFEAGGAGSTTGLNQHTDTEDPAVLVNDETEDARECLAAGLEWFTQQLDAELPDAVDHDTPRDYYHARGWSDETIDAKALGYAPADTKDRLLTHLHREGFDRETILATGLFREWDDGNLSATWSGRYVLPYLDGDGRPAFAISRATDPAHPSDWAGRYGEDDDPAKYHKIAVSREEVLVEEPIYGLETVRAGEPVLITEGIADAIAAHQAGFPCVSPVTTSFKNDDRERLVDTLEERDVPRVYLIQDAERPGSDLDDREELTLQQHGEGTKGAVRTAEYLATHGVDARIGELPRPGLDKVDLDDYLRTWSDDLTPILAGAKPVDHHPAHDPNAAKRAALDAADARTPDPSSSSGTGSALFALDVSDVLGVGDGYRGTNPLGHHGESENYFVVEDGLGYDHKHKAAYNALTAVLVDAGERPPGRPNGRLDDGEVFTAWQHAKAEGLLATDDPIPTRALQHIADTHTDWSGDFVERETHDGDTFDALPVDVYNAALETVREEYDLDPGRRPVGEGSDPDAEHTAVLPPAVRDLATAASGWDWRHAAEEHDLTKEDVQDRTADTITEAFRRGEDTLTIALPSSGKTYGVPLAAARTGEPTTILTGRGRKEQYDQLAKWCEKHGLTYKILPSFTEDCPVAAGEHGEEWEETVDKWYRAGATPKQIHMYAEETLGRPLPCQIDDDGNHVGCPYKHKWDFDPETDGSADPEEDVPIDVLIGHYTHAYREEKVVHGRTVAIDEHPGGAYQTELGMNLQGAVSYWLETVDAIPFESYTDLVENRSDESRRADALLWFDEHGIDPDGKHVFGADGSTHAAAPLAVFTLLTADDLGNGWERADLGEHGIGVRTDGRDYRNGRDRVFTLSPPDFQYANAVVALDGTPTKEMWELSLDTRLSDRPVLDDDERADYIRTALNMNIVRTTEHVKTYNNPDYVNTEEDAALLKAIAEEHGARPAVISTMTALDEYDAEDILQYVDGKKHHGNVLGSNIFSDTRLGAVIGSNNYGDGFVKRWGAYANVAVESPDRSDPENRGTGLSYGAFGDKILQHMREHDTLQAVMRFGRDGNGAVVYVHTNTLPDWVPVAGEGEVIRTKSDGERRVVDAVEELGSATTATIAEHADLSRRQTFTHLERLREEGYLSRQQDTDDGRSVRWVDDELHRVNDHGEVQLDPIDLDALAEEEVAEVARSSIYTWDFRNSATDQAGGGGASSAEEGRADDRARTDGGRPPDPPA